MTFEEHIARNKRLSVLILGLVFLIFFSLIWAIGFLLGTPPTFTFVLALVVTGVYLAVMYGQSVNAVIWATGARPANPNVLKERLLVHRVEEMAIAAGLPAPKVYVQDSKDINAFAAGKHPQEAIVCATTGALDLLDQEELQGVIGHEMAHVLNYDVRLATITVALVGAIAMLAEIMLRSLFWGGGRRGGGKGGGGHPALIVVAILLAILAPIFARLVYLLLSRRREYLADATGVRLTRNPEGLARALEKIRGDLPDDPKGSKTVASLYIANPWTRQSLNSVWSTHPPLDDRIKRIRAM